MPLCGISIFDDPAKNRLGLRESVADGWLTLCEFQLIDAEGNTDSPGITHLTQRLYELSPADGFGDLKPAMLQRLLEFWQTELKQDDKSTILSHEGVRSLAAKSKFRAALPRRTLARGAEDRTFADKIDQIR